MKPYFALSKYARRVAVALAAAPLVFFSCSNPTSITTSGPTNAASSTPNGTGTLASSTLVASLEMDTWGMNIKDLFSIQRPSTTKSLTTATAGSTSYFPNFSFYLQRGVAITGYDVYRSTDESNWTKVATANLGTPTQSYPNLKLTFTDMDPGLSLGSTYYYEVQGFDSAGDLTPLSALTGAAFLPAYTLSLDWSTYTADASTVPTQMVDHANLGNYSLSFSISNAALWSASVSNYFYFALIIADTVNGDVAPTFYGEFRYNFAQGRFEKPAYNADGTADWSSSATASGISYASGTITLNLGGISAFYDPNSGMPSQGLSLAPGATYQWNIYGDWYGNSQGYPGDSTDMDSAAFSRAGTGNAVSVSFSNTYMDGEGASNGSFLFQAQ